MSPDRSGGPKGLVRLVARREIVTRLRERSFLISTVVTLLIIVAVVVLPSLFNRGDDGVTVGIVGESSTVEPALQQAARLSGATLTVQRYGDETAARAAVDSGDADAVFVDADRVVVKEELGGRTEEVVQTAYRQAAVTRRLDAAGIDPAAVTRALDVPPLAITALSPPDPDADARRGGAGVGVLLL